ncbi:hypothetical protein DH2020_019243 [Rehmannia glutinosa]|uniref:Serine-threonine/tyrosine-protein kinase catalytic domain-containing protein n=1 Tax=Rehmannia glutinosa TaxID=99300 RepID=A0ABR0WN29_REHGL
MASQFAWREADLLRDSFSEKNVLGQGGLKRFINECFDNTKVVVKCLTDFESPGGDTTFQREVEMISVAFHEKSLRLIGFCTTPMNAFWFYPFTQNLSVASLVMKCEVLHLCSYSAVKAAISDKNNDAVVEIVRDYSRRR